VTVPSLSVCLLGEQSKPLTIESSFEILVHTYILFIWLKFRGQCMSIPGGNVQMLVLAQAHSVVVLIFSLKRVRVQSLSLLKHLKTTRNGLLLAALSSKNYLAQQWTTFGAIEQENGVVFGYIKIDSVVI